MVISVITVLIISGLMIALIKQPKILKVNEMDIKENLKGYYDEDDPEIRSALNYTPIGFEIKPDNKTIHFWNTKDDYYLDNITAIQWTNIPNENWTKNVFCMGYKTTDWNYKCVDSLNVNWIMESDNVSYVHIIGWRDVTFGQYEVRYAINYSLDLLSEELKITQYLKNIGTKNITNDLAYAWIMEDINILNDNDIDKITINGTEYILNQDNITFIDPYPYYKIYDNNNILKGYVSLRWNENISANVKIIDNNKTNNDVAVILKTTGLLIGQTKSTIFFWRDPLTSGSIIPINPVNGEWGSDNNLTCEFNAGGDQMLNVSIMNGTQYLLTEWPGELKPDNALWDGNLIMALHINNDSSYGENQTFYYDYSGLGNDARAYSGTGVGEGAGHDSGTQHVQSGRFDKGFYNNQSDEYLRVEHDAIFNPPSQQITISVWVKSNEATWNDYVTLVSKRSQFLFGPWKGGTRMDYVIYNSTANCGYSYTAAEILNWHMYTLVFNGTHVIAYFDGDDKGNKQCNQLRNTDTGNMYIGRDDGNARYLNGSIDEVLIWNRSLTATEVQALFNGTRDIYTMNITIPTPPQGINSYGCNAWDNTLVNIWNNASYAIDPVSLWLPANGTTDTDGTVTFSINVTPTGYEEIKNVTLYTNISGTWKSNKTFYPNATTKYIFNHTIIGIPNGGYIWNALAYNNLSNFDWGNMNYTLTVSTAGGGDTVPTVVLHSPPDDNISTSGNVTFTCNVTDDRSIVNVSLYGNFSSWDINQTIDLGGANLSYQANFSINFTSNASYIWNCYACDNASNCSWGDNNYTLSINVSKIITPSIDCTLPEIECGCNFTTVVNANNQTITIQGEGISLIYSNITYLPRTGRAIIKNNSCRIHKNGTWQRNG